MTSHVLQSSGSIVILDRDGVINQDSTHFVKSPEEWIPIPGSVEAIARLSKAGTRVVVATNQSGIARKLFDESLLAQIHHKMCSMVEQLGGSISAIYFCPHAPDANCLCRKPAIGLLQQIEQEQRSSLSGCYFIGDSERDVQAARAFGCIPVLVRTGNGRATEQLLVGDRGETLAVFDNLADAVEKLFFTNHAQ